MNSTTGASFLRLVEIMDDLREKCPWDKKQTIQSLRQMTIEEMYELADAITEGDWKGIKEELGDLLLHILFYAKIGSEQKQFELEEVINGICEKLIARHPHIYGDVKVNDAEDVKRNWEKLKLKEGKKSVIGGIPPSLPATVKAMRLQEKAKQVGFEWDNKEQVWEKVEEEIEELKVAIRSLEEAGVGSLEAGVGSLEAGVGSRESEVGSQDPIAIGSGVGSQDPIAMEKLQGEVEEEFGDVVFSLINYARFLQVDAENALEKTNKKFIHRFTQMEQQALQSGKDLNSMTLQEMDAIWNTIKQQRQEQ
ncbi:MAG: nucleoside triphosphate pyrophosphohydrolase [Ferruginibacter sp.]|nr:nucleoside triphosphate pyrophosphohydrolase [Chitinophagaceae bacterium]